jgi:signal transduction histidine kinase
MHEANAQLAIQTVPAILHADRDKLLQVLINLLSNALKACEGQACRIHIHSRIEAGALRVEISDTGKGISEEVLPFIFDKFFQAKNQTHQKPKGSGLGLAICKKIVEMHQGRIWASSTGKGATFHLILPLEEGSEKTSLFAKK